MLQAMSVSFVADKHELDIHIDRVVRYYYFVFYALENCLDCHSHLWEIGVLNEILSFIYSL